jgi:F0F1-type ATP synthase delta subunit
MRSEKITPREHKELIELIDRVEIENSRRIQLLIEVAKRQGTTVEALLKTTRTASAL